MNLQTRNGLEVAGDKIAEAGARDVRPQEGLLGVRIGWSGARVGIVC